MGVLDWPLIKWKGQLFLYFFQRVFFLACMLISCSGWEKLKKTKKQNKTKTKKTKEVISDQGFLIRLSKWPKFQHFMFHEYIEYIFFAYIDDIDGAVEGQLKEIKM